MSNWMIYGANGYTGQLIAREAVKRGHKRSLRRRSAAALEPLAGELSLPPGPSRSTIWKGSTARSMASLPSFTARGRSSTRARDGRGLPSKEASLPRHHGEIAVFETIMRRDGDAKRSGVALVPGVGFDVVPSDCSRRYSPNGCPTRPTSSSRSTRREVASAEEPSAR